VAGFRREAEQLPALRAKAACVALCGVATPLNSVSFIAISLFVVDGLNDAVIRRRYPVGADKKSGRPVPQKNLAPKGN
jgi:hypothetical protein